MTADTRALALSGLVLLMALGSAPACRRQPPAPAAARVEYACPMHPTFVADAPGTCPVCGMQLTARTSHSRRRAARAPAPSSAAEGPAGVAGEGDASGAEVVDSSWSGRVVAGRAALSLDEASRRLLGVRTEPVRRMRLVRQIRAAGEVTARGPHHATVVTEVYENDLPSLRTGMEAALTVLYLPGKGWRGEVAAIAPAVDARTRTVRLRIEAEDPGGDLRPGMFADVYLKRDLGEGLMVPDTAVIYLGSRRLVFVEHDDGRLEPREVRLGPNVGAGFQVLSGLGEGEPVVASANFLIDSESSLRGAVASLAAFEPSRPDTGAPAGGERR